MGRGMPSCVRCNGESNPDEYQIRCGVKKNSVSVTSTRPAIRKATIPEGLSNWGLDNSGQ